jgi:AcrR family transcriptional regulator
MLETESASIEERIIAAAIACIEQYGLQGATNRKIAKMAGVNSAAINYYFRSKDVLIERCMQATLASIYPWSEAGGLPGSTPGECCAAVFDQLIQTACRLPGVTRALFYDLLVSGSPASPAVSRLNQFLVQLAQSLLAKGTEMAEEELHLATAQVAAAVLLVSLAPRIFEEGFGLDLNDADMRQVFVQRLVDRLL